MYLKLEEKWHRFYLDACCLFWHEGRPPDPENDLEDGDEYVDWGAQLGVVGSGLCVVVRDMTHNRSNCSKLVVLTCSP